MRERDDDRQGAGAAPGAGSPSDPGPDQATFAAAAADNLVEAVMDLLDILVEAPEGEADLS